MLSILAVPLAAALLAPVLDEPVDIARLAPADSWVFLTVPDWPRLIDASKASGLEGLWNEPSVREFLNKLFDEDFKEFKEALDAIDAKPEDLVQPTGGVGAAIFDAPGAEGGATVNLVAAADFGDRADAAQELLDKAIDAAVDDRRLEIKEDRYGEAKVLTLTLLEPEDVGPGDDADDEFDFEEPETGFFAGHTEMFLARLGGAFVASTNLAALENALDSLSGDDIDALADAPAYADTLAQHGGGSLACAGLMLPPLLASMAENMAESGVLPPDADMNAVLRVLGLGDVQSISLGLSPGLGEVAACQTAGVLATQKRGLVALFDFPDAPLSPPTFVGPDSASFTRFSVNFPRLLPLVREVVGTLPRQTRGFIEQQVEALSQLAGPVLESMGPEVYIATSFTMPFSETSERQVVAVPVRDGALVGNLLEPLGVWDSTDFQGHTIWRPTQEGMGVPSIGVGFGHLFLGPAPGVEALMRNAANPGGPRLADEPRFQRAARALNSDAPIFAYAETEPSLRYLSWQVQNAPGEVEATPFSPLDPLGALKGKLPPVEVLIKHLGDTVWSLRSTPDGFRGTLLWLRPPVE